MIERAFVVCIPSDGQDIAPEALKGGHLLMGWAEAKGLLDESLPRGAFRQIIQDAYYRDQPTRHQAGVVERHMWRFIRDMQTGDLVVVPHGSEFYVAEITDPAIHRADKVQTDTAYRRPVRWLNGGKPISRRFACAALRSRMNIVGLSADATDLIGDIRASLHAG